jgi:hypothetical protein
VLLLKYNDCASVYVHNDEGKRKFGITQVQKKGYVVLYMHHKSKEKRASQKVRHEDNHVLIKLKQAYL